MPNSTMYFFVFPVLGWLSSSQYGWKPSPACVIKWNYIKKWDSMIVSLVCSWYKYKRFGNVLRITELNICVPQVLVCRPPQRPPLQAPPGEEGGGVIKKITLCLQITQGRGRPAYIRKEKFNYVILTQSILVSIITIHLNRLFNLLLHSSHNFS